VADFSSDPKTASLRQQRNHYARTKFRGKIIRKSLARRLPSRGCVFMGKESPPAASAPRAFTSQSRGTLTQMAARKFTPGPQRIHRRTEPRPPPEFDL